MEDSVKTSDNTLVKFKRREPKQTNVRRKSTDEEEEEEDTVNTEKINEFKLLKTLKSRDVGIEYGSDGQVAKRESGKRESSSAPDLSSRLSSQFSSQIDRGIGVNIAHEQIMQKYIDEKLGLGKEDDQKVKKHVDTSGLYSIPTELVVESSLTVTQVRVANEEGTASSWSTGIAEVALPESYRDRNRRATEIAAMQKRIEEENQAQVLKALVESKEASGFHRFQLPGEARDAHMKLIPSEVVPVVKTIASSTGVQGENSSGQSSFPNENPSRTKRPSTHSTDDAAFKRFKQNLNHRFR